MFSLGSLGILIVELLLLFGVYFYALKKLIPNYFGNINKKVAAENIRKAKKGLYLFTASVFFYMVFEFLGFKPYVLHIVASIVFMLFMLNIIEPFTLKRWGKDSFRLEEVEDKFLIEKLLEARNDKNKFEYEDENYFFRADKFQKQVAVKKSTSKSEFWAGFFAVMIWSFLVLNLAYILKVEMGAPEIMVTLFAFIIAYVLSPFYPDLYTTYVFAKDEEVGFDKFVEVKINGSTYFGSIKKLTFFKIAIKDHYNDTLVTFFHKLFLNAVMISFPNGKFIEKRYVVSKYDQNKLLELILLWITEKYDKKNPYDNPIITFFSHNYGYGVKLRINVKVEFLEKYGSLKDDLEHLIVTKSNENEIDLRTFDEVNFHMKGEEKIVIPSGG